MAIGHRKRHRHDGDEEQDEVTQRSHSKLQRL
jgi:hypothetical protein